MKRGSLAVLALVFSALLSQAQTSSNLLVDPSFEEWAGDPTSPRWAVFQNAYCVAVTARTRVFVTKIYGNFTSEQNYSGIWQDVPAGPGREYVASAYLRQNVGDTLQGDDEAWLKLEFFDAGGKLVQVFESPRKMKAKDAAGKYVFFSTGPVASPPGTVTARFVVIFGQGPDNAPGAVLVDDVLLMEVP
ncbi:MAG: hypothetical protein V1873_03395 [Verrucomicrobiota bacterium]